MTTLIKVLLILSTLNAYGFSIYFSLKRGISSKLMGAFMFISFLIFSLFLGVRQFEIEELLSVFILAVPFLSITTHPLLYLYINHITSIDPTEKLTYYIKQKWLHFLPSIIVFIGSLVSFAFNGSTHNFILGEETIINKNTPQNVILVFSTSVIILYAQVIFYGFLIIKSLKRHDVNINNFFSFKKDVNLKWLKLFVGFYLLYYFIDILLFLFYEGTENIHLYYAFFTIQIHFMGVMAYRQKRIYRPLQKDTSNEVNQLKNEKHIDDNQDIKLLELYERIERQMKDNKLFKNEDLSLYDVAKSLGTNQKYVSEAINNHAKVNFFSYVNKYRIEEIKKVLVDPEYDQLSIEGLAKSCGFKSRGVFYPIFKKETGMTPGEYKKQFNK